MRNKKKRTQREEVRKVLHAMRLELAAQRIAQEQSAQPTTMMRLGEVMSRARSVAN